MGRFQQDLELISGLLGAGLGVDQGFNMLLQAQQAKADRRDANQAAISTLAQQYAPATATSTYNEIASDLGTMGPIMGLNDRQTDKVLGKLEPLYEYGPNRVSVLATQWDAQDDKLVIDDIKKLIDDDPRYLQDRQALREAIRNDWKQRLGDQIFNDLHEKFDQAIDAGFTQLGGESQDKDNSLAAQLDATSYDISDAADRGMDLREYMGAKEGWIGLNNARQEGGFFSPYGGLDWIDDNLLFGALDSATKIFADEPLEEPEGDYGVNWEEFPSFLTDVGHTVGANLVGGAVAKAGLKALPHLANFAGRAAPRVSQWGIQHLAGVSDDAGLDALVAKYGAAPLRSRIPFVKGGEPGTKATKIGSAISDIRQAGRAESPGGLMSHLPFANIARGRAPFRAGLAGVADNAAAVVTPEGAAAGSVVDDIAPDAVPNWNFAGPRQNWGGPQASPFWDDAAGAAAPDVPTGVTPGMELAIPGGISPAVDEAATALADDILVYYSRVDPDVALTELLSRVMNGELHPAVVQAAMQKVPATYRPILDGVLRRIDGMNGLPGGTGGVADLFRGAQPGAGIGPPPRTSALLENEAAAAGWVDDAQVAIPDEHLAAQQAEDAAQAGWQQADELLAQQADEAANGEQQVAVWVRQASNEDLLAAIELPQGAHPFVEQELLRRGFTPPPGYLPGGVAPLAEAPATGLNRVAQTSVSDEIVEPGLLDVPESLAPDPIDFRPDHDPLFDETLPEELWGLNRVAQKQFMDDTIAGTGYLNRIGWGKDDWVEGFLGAENADAWKQMVSEAWRAYHNDYMNPTFQAILDRDALLKDLARATYKPGGTNKKITANIRRWIDQQPSEVAERMATPEDVIAYQKALMDKGWDYYVPMKWGGGEGLRSGGVAQGEIRAGVYADESLNRFEDDIYRKISNPHLTGTGGGAPPIREGGIRTGKYPPREIIDDTPVGDISPKVKDTISQLLDEVDADTLFMHFGADSYGDLMKVVKNEGMSEKEFLKIAEELIDLGKPGLNRVANRITTGTREERKMLRETNPRRVIQEMLRAGEISKEDIPRLLKKLGL